MTSLLSCQEIVDSITTCVVVLDDTMKVVTLNSSAEVLFKISQRQALHIPLQSLLPGETSLFASLKRVQDTGQALIEREIKLYIPTTGEKVFDCAIKLIHQDQGKTHTLLELTQLDFQQRVSREDNLHTQQQVLRGLAHEIKNPLGGLRGAAQLLERQLDSNDLKEYTNIIISEADRLQNLMAKMLGPYHKSEKQDVNVHQVLQHVRNLVEIEVDKRMKFKGDYDPSIPTIYVDYDQLIQICLNIVRNAMQALKGIGLIVLRTRVVRNITIDKKHQRLAVAIEIEDNGPGVPQKLQDSLFYPLVSGRAEGTGLGLYLVQNLVQRNSGTVSCRSQPGQTVFSIIFPLELDESGK
jgi:two-component system nitrogen regulation sensor histidine kinase GlnL